MVRSSPTHIVVIGAGAAGLMTARELGRAGKRVTLLEARDRCGGRIDPLSSAQFGYPAEGGAEFVHGEAPVTRSLLREARISLLPIEGTQRTVMDGKLSTKRSLEIYEASLQTALKELDDDLTVAEFLRRHFASAEHDHLRRSVERMVEGYDAADPERASMLALRDEWMGEGRRTQVRIAGGYGRLIDFLVARCRSDGVAIYFNSVVNAIASAGPGALIRCANGAAHKCDVVVLTVPLPLLKDISLPPAERERAAAAADIGFGNVIKILMRFQTRWWLDERMHLADLTFLLSEARIPVWWTQYPADFPVLTGWFGGPKTAGMAHLNEQELIEAGLTSLADVFGLAPEQLGGLWWRHARSIGRVILSLAGRIRMQRPKRARRNRCFQAPMVDRCSSPAKPFTVGKTWVRSRRRWRAAWRRRKQSSATSFSLAAVLLASK
jgi:monoamine oxidase